MKPYRVYCLMTDAFLNSYDSYGDAQEAHSGQPVTIIYRPGRRKKVKK